MMSVALYLPFVLEGCCGSRGTGLQQRVLGPPLGPSLLELGTSMLRRSGASQRPESGRPPYSEA